MRNAVSPYFAGHGLGTTEQRYYSCIYEAETGAADAHQDKEDDVLVGVRSTALLFGPRTQYWLAGFYFAALVLFAGAGLRAELNSLYYVGLGLVALHFTWQAWRLDIDDVQDCWAKFVSNKWLGLLITISIVLGQTG